MFLTISPVETKSLKAKSFECILRADKSPDAQIAQYTSHHIGQQFFAIKCASLRRKEGFK